MAKRQRKTETAKPPRRLWRRIFYWGAVMALWVGIGVAGLVGYYAMDLPDTQQLWKVENSPEFRFYGAEEKLLARRGRLQGRPLLFRDLPPDLVHAVVAIEDRRFFSHFGLDFRGLARAMVSNIRSGAVVAGGSTLTQQLAKNVFLDPERTLKRKVQELLLAFWMEATLTKEEIFALYMNRVYFGAGAYGVHAASETYFNRPVPELTLGEAATLAGLLKAPSRLAPNRNPSAAHDRAQLVLQAMVDAGYLKDTDLADDPLSKVTIVTRSNDTAHYAIDWALEQLPDFIGRPRTDLDVVTTLDPVMQLAAEQAARHVLDASGQDRKVSQVAMVIMTPQGAVRAMVGGRSYEMSQYNRAILAQRQPGSAFKPIIYLAALEAGYKPGDILQDTPFSVGDWSPQNYDRLYRGPVTLTDALANSLNTVAAQLSEAVGRETVIETARRLGITSPLYPHPSIALGVFELSLIELTATYATLANGGYRTFPYIIEEVVSHSGNEFYSRRAGAAVPVIKPEIVQDLQDMLVAGVESGTGRGAHIDGLRIGGKTGTSQTWRDAWFIGMTGDLVVGVWVGNDDGSPMDRITGGSIPAQIFREFMVAQARMNPMAPFGNSKPADKRRGLFDWLFGN